MIQPDMLSLLMDFEDGQLDEAGSLELFAYPIKTGKAWVLQGFYGRAANDLIQNKRISPEGEIL